MKFSFTLIKKLVPVVKNKRDLIEKLNLYSFEVADAGGDVFDVSIPPNRFSDVASHFGIGREIAAILGVRFRTDANQRTMRTQRMKSNSRSSRNLLFDINIQDKNLCPRYAAQYFENIKVGPSPKWMQKVLTDCGLRPVSNVVDIMNYAMLETGQPLHAFDFDKLTQTNADYTRTNTEKRPRKSAFSPCKSVIVRRAKKGEKIRTIDDKLYELNENILVIADARKPIAIAGIKGGKDTEVDKNTKRIIVEAANFDGVSIYKSSRFLKLATDASLRFSHNIIANLVPLGLNRAAELLKGVINAKAGRIIDVNSTKTGRKIIKFDPEHYERFIGIKLESSKARDYLERLGFKITNNPKLTTHNSFLVEVPPLRQDIETFEDLAEEVTRLYGYNNVKSAPPHIHLIPSGFEDQIVLKDKVRRILLKMGLDEVYNYSFISKDNGEEFVFGKELVELENPISKEFYYLRPSLAMGLYKNVENNFKFKEEIRIFELGKTFAKETHKKITERLVLGIALASKNREAFFELKGMVRELFRKSGLVDYLIAVPGTGKNNWVKDFTKEYLDRDTVLKIESGDIVFGYLGQLKSGFSKRKINLFEIDLDALLKLVVEEHEYRPLPKYPSIMRDISMTVAKGARVGNIMQAIQEFDLKYIEDVDLIDEYDLAQTSTDTTRTRTEFSDKSALSQCRSVTFRIVFQAEDRTLTDQEVNQKMEKIEKLLQSKFKAKIR